MTLLRSLFAVFFISSLAVAQTSSLPCQPSPEIAAALAALPVPDNVDLPWEQRIGPARALAHRYPNDLFVQLHYQDAFHHHYWLAEEYDSALAFYASMPDKTLAQYLTARLLWRSHLRESQDTLQNLLQTHPSFPWPHLDLVEIAESPGISDTPTVESHLRTFLAACPDSLEAYDHFKSVNDPQLIRDGAERLRKLLAGRSDPEMWQYDQALWSLEFRASPDHEQARQRVRDDVKRLQSLPALPGRYWYSAFVDASELIQDPALKVWLNSTVMSQLTDSSLAYQVTEEKWMGEHPAPPPQQGEARRKWELERFNALDQWGQRWPNSPYPILQQHGLVLVLPELSTDKVLEVIDRYAALVDTRPDAVYSAPPFQIMAAREYVKRKVRLERVPGMIEAGLQQAEKQEKYRTDMELFPPTVREKVVDWPAMARDQASLILADFYLLDKDAAKARDILTQATSDLSSRKPDPSAPRQTQDQFRYHEREYLLRAARLDQLDGKPQQALGDYQQMLGLLSRAALESEKMDDVKEAKQFYLEHGGAQGNWLTWATSAAQPSPPATELSFTNPLPNFEVKDVTGRVWRTSDFLGKVTLLDFWATWCGSCRGELPYIQKVYDQVKAKKDLQVVTISVDENPGLLEAYLKETHFTFPILPAKDLAEQIFPVVMLPQTWIIDPHGRRSQDQFMGAGDEWVTRIIARMEAVRTGKNSRD